MLSTVRPWGDPIEGPLGNDVGRTTLAGQQLQVTDALAPEENDTEPLPPLRQMLSCRVTWTEAL
jgi:hypothetical protein